MQFCSNYCSNLELFLRLIWNVHKTYLTSNINVATKFQIVNTSGLVDKTQLLTVLDGYFALGRIMV